VSRRLLAVLSLAFVLFSPLLAAAGELTRSALQTHLPPPLQAREKLPELAAWPLVIPGSDEAAGYAFESVDFAPIPGYEGTPVNLLVVVDRQGNFVHVEVLQQHEPMFVFSGLGEGPLREFVRQYIGKNLTQEISIAGGSGPRDAASHRTVIDGIAKATATVRVVHKSILSSALAVARARLGVAGKGADGPRATVRDDVFTRLVFPELLRRGLVGRRTVSNAEGERQFAGTEWAGIDREGLQDPEGVLVDLYVAYLNAPTIGRALLGDAGYRRLIEKLEPGQSALWVASAGRYSMEDENFTPGGESRRLSLAQNGLPLEMRNLIFDLPAIEGAPHFENAHIFTVFAEAGLNPGQALDLTLRLVRAKGMGIPRVMEQPLLLSYQVPDELLSRPPAPAPEWLAAWRARAPDLAVIVVFLLLLSLLLARPRIVAASARRLRIVRLVLLAFTLGYIGWYAQGQLSVVQITGALKALAAGQGLGIFLYDPVALLLIGFTIASFFVWGRGTFCGWLCPFGALQEFVGLAARRLGIPQYRPPAALLRHLPRLRYAMLALLCAAALIAPRASETLVEVEPFKTAITVGFDRSWPYVAYALALLVAGACYFKFFCRVLCPLGAAMSLGGRLRRWNWLPRRAECGRPCQTCRHRCEYDAIGHDGAIRYDDCFQCLDCVGIYHDANRCAPVLLYRRKGKSVAPHAMS
jgi:transcriptional regulator of nitric oxide reductase